MSYLGQSPNAMMPFYRSPDVRTWSTQVIYAGGALPPTPMTFVRKTRQIPGQPYQMLPLTPTQVEAELYKDLPKKGRSAPQPGATPVKLIRTDTGLEVPEYLLKREAVRKQEEIIKRNTPEVIPPSLARVGGYAASSPGKTVLIALGVGYLCASLLA